MIENKKIKVLNFSVPYTTYQASVYHEIASNEIEFNYATLKKMEYWVKIKIKNPYYHEKTFQYYSIPIKKDSYGTYKEYLSFGVLKYILKLKPDLMMLAPELGLSFLYILFAKLVGSKIIGYTTTIPNMSSIWGRLTAFNLKKNNWLIDHYIVPSSMKKEFLKDIGIKGKKISVIGHGVDIQKFSPEIKATDLKIPTNKKIILSIGIMVPTKGKKFLLESFRIMSENRDDVFLIMIGKGEQKPELVKFIQQHNLEDKVLLLDQVSNSEMPKYYSVADVVVVSAINKESFGPVYLEAMASGNPVIAFQTGGCDKDLIIHKKNGLLVQPKDVSALTKAIEGLFNDDFSRLQMGKFARDFIEKNYSFESLAKIWRNLLKSIAINKI